jgi:hypothetical protein
MTQVLEFEPWTDIQDRTFWMLARRQHYWLRANPIAIRWSSPSDEQEKAIGIMMANKAHAAIENLGDDFKRENRGRYIVMSYDGQTLALGDSMRDIRTQLAAKGVHGGAVIERIGFKSLAKFSR